MQMGRCAIVQFVEGQTICRQTHEWCAPGLVSHHLLLQNVPASQHIGWIDKLREGEIQYVPDVRLMPEEMREERKLFESLGIASLLHIPLRPHGELVGVLGISSGKPILAPSPDDIILLKIAGQLFANVLAQQQLFSERENLIQELEFKNQELEQFTYMVSHDLKSPLISMNGFLGALKKDLEGDDHKAVEEDFVEIYAATSKMKQLLDELLTVSRLGGQIANQSAVVSMEEIMQAQLRQFDSEMKQKKISVVQSRLLPDVWGDRVRLESVVQNLLGNFIKFSPEDKNGEIRLEFEQREGDNEVLFRFSDNGIGIEPKFHHKVFGLFEKLNPSSQGTGVGLAIVKRIIEQHDGTIRVESEGENKGTTFLFTLPTRSF